LNLQLNEEMYQAFLSLLSFSGVKETEALAKIITTKNIVNTSRDMISGLKNMNRESNL
jgi:hypothetical protein